MKNKKDIAALALVVLFGAVAIASVSYYQEKIALEISQNDRSVIELFEFVTAPTSSPQAPQTPMTPVAPTENQGELKLEFITYVTGCMFKDCTPDYAPQSVQHLVLGNGDEFGTATTYEPGKLFTLVSHDGKITVRMADHVSPLVGRALAPKGSDSLYVFSDSACFSLNNWDDIVPSFCLVKPLAGRDLDFQTVSKNAR